MLQRDAESVCAVVVAFHPDEFLDNELRSIIRQVDALVVIDNTPSEHRLRHIRIPSDDSKQILLLENLDNRGVASALNQGLEQAVTWHCRWLLTLDQDTHCLPNMVSTLKEIGRYAMQGTYIIGSNYLDQRNGRDTFHVKQDMKYIEQKTVITSGSLVDCQFATQVGGFREDYFIDQLDHEFCFRVRANGGKAVVSRDVLMVHSVGEDGGAWLPILGYLPNHQPIRKYYTARNSIVTIKEYWRQEPVWCLVRAIRLSLGLVLMLALESQRLVKSRAYFLGIVDGLRGKMGKFDEKCLY
jgi:rhamnosyltransferase